MVISERKYPRVRNRCTYSLQGLDTKARWCSQIPTYSVSFDHLGAFCYHTQDIWIFLSNTSPRRYVWNGLLCGLDFAFPSPRPRPNYLIGCYTDLLSIAVQKQTKRPANLRLPSHVFDVLWALDDAITTRLVNQSSTWPDLSTIITYESYAVKTYGSPDVVYNCCLLAMALFWKAMG